MNKDKRQILSEELQIDERQASRLVFAGLDTAKKVQAASDERLERLGVDRKRIKDAE